MYLLISILMQYKPNSLSARECPPNVPCGGIGKQRTFDEVFDPAIGHGETPRNVHSRHKFSNSERSSKFEQEMYRNSFLHRILPYDYISRVFSPVGAVTEAKLFRWQTPSTWVYPAGNEEDDGVKDPNDHTGGIPEVADKECLARCNIPWYQKKGTKVYLKVSSLSRVIDCRLRWRVPMNLGNILLSNMSMRHLLRIPPGFTDLVLALVIRSRWTVKSLSSERNLVPAKQIKMKLAWNLL